MTTTDASAYGDTVEKDESLSLIARTHNIAQFVSFDANLRQRFAHVRGFETDHIFDDLEDAAENILAASTAGTVNIRTFGNGAKHGTPFTYGIDTKADLLLKLREMSGVGWSCIVNETIDVHDGGVSGVFDSGTIEIIPDDTPRGVEGAGVARFDHKLAKNLLRLIYGAELELEGLRNRRVEFSVHPQPVGIASSKVIVWEVADAVGHASPASGWPNRLSRMLGDKAYGLIIGHLLGAAVPRTTVIGRRLAPFTFGTPTHSTSGWLRTAPPEPVPGRFTTVHGWVDPFQLMATEDPDGRNLQAILWQESVESRYSGAALITGQAHSVIEGVQGFGDNFMLGQAPPSEVPHTVRNDIFALLTSLQATLGPVRAEWAHDGKDAWLLQLHSHRQHAVLDVADGADSPASFLLFNPDDGVRAFEDVASIAAAQGRGIELTRSIGLTSHLVEIAKSKRVTLRVPEASTDTRDTPADDGSPNPVR